ncbi:MAG: hypothetical protein A3D34_02580 [Candidatus Staskawiczbacteria bacterium RIFCSPHIGHO2_02_FULL_33_16]|uniref:Glycerophosphoryl diester phosphodiesterase membrane domain-containing protein n=1 Tax=Candidatus Staskawiczbacteria bacterium RIFCSPHIGHO2_02_FULL_33_16 TaxID=1802204 RepID=A0A1G2HUA4_9BACT|nr:MAG: hypothetical protein A3D34_02580 [Candidatus Staskawiczbacteria bacterium RIFCSPHIGHO2_02_FULL_33_16]OGZ70794.1 MAG: hypothetical protein A2980_02070 [Candidatus Staskawiczbacteria bacterium RIFCSPLOWO2_01_FULL_33_13]
MNNKKLISISDLFKKSFDFYKNNIKILLGVALIGYIPILIAYLLEIEESLSLVSWILFLIIFVLNFLTYIAFFYVIKETKEGVSEKNYIERIKRLFAKASGNIFPVFLISLLSFLCIIGGLILFIIPGIIFATWFVFSNYAFIFEGTKGKKALLQSKELVKGYWWPVFLRFLLICIFSALVSLIPFFGDILNFLLINPLCVIFGYFIYEDLKTIKSSNLL